VASWLIDMWDSFICSTHSEQWRCDSFICVSHSEQWRCDAFICAHCVCACVYMYSRKWHWDSCTRVTNSNMCLIHSDIVTHMCARCACVCIYMYMYMLSMCARCSHMSESWCYCARTLVRHDFMSHSCVYTYMLSMCARWNYDSLMYVHSNITTHSCVNSVVMTHTCVCTLTWWRTHVCAQCAISHMMSLCARARHAQCHTLQHTAAHCNTLHHTATLRSTLQHTATHCNTLQQTHTHTQLNHSCQCNPHFQNLQKKQVLKLKRRK